MDDGNGGYRSRGNGRGGSGGNGNGGGRGGFDRGRDDRQSGRRERDNRVGGDEPPQRRQRFEGDGTGAPRRGARPPREFVDRPPDERFDFVSSRGDANFDKRGKTGQPLSLLTNYFHLEKRPMWKIYHYHVGFEPEEKFTRVKLVLLNVHRDQLGVHIFDGHSLWTFQPLQVPMELYSAERRGSERMVKLTIKLVGELEHTDVQCIQVYNVILRKCFELLKLEQIGRNYYDKEQAIDFYQGQFELWPGYITTIRNYEQGLMLNVEIAHRLLRKDTALDLILRHSRHGQYDEDAIRKALVGCTVMTSYNRTMYRIDDVDFEKTPQSTFKMGREKVETSYADYYYEKYRQQIRHMQQPLIGSRPKKKDFHRGKREMVYLIPETCQMTGLNDEIRGNFNLMKEMGKYTHQVPARKSNAIQVFMERLNGHQQIKESLREWGLKFTTHAVETPGRVVPPEKIIMEPKGRDVKDIFPDDRWDWSHAFRGSVKMCTNMKLSGNWILLVPIRDQGGVDNLIQTMNRTAGQLGFAVTPPLQTFPLPQPYPEAYVTAIKQGLSNHGKKVELVFAVLPNNKLEVYAAIKKICCVDLGIASQCFVAKNLNSPKGLMSIATKVVIQMNAKLGGEPWRVVNPFKSSNLMVVGYDLYHCGKRRGSSVGAMVASTNKELSKFYSTLSTVDVTRNREFSETMCADMTKCLNAFKKRNNGALPDRIIMYRDGVGEGQLKYVHAVELAEIKECLKGIYLGLELPKLTFIVVTKKINTRLFAQRPNGLDNPSPGTIVDDVVTLPERYDFYLISQTARQGTVAPTCYNVIWDQQGIDPDKLQRFSYKLTHMYFNWSGTVSVPAVCQYAHKMSYLAGITMNGLPIQERLCDNLFYL